MSDRKYNAIRLHFYEGQYPYSFKVMVKDLMPFLSKLTIKQGVALIKLHLNLILKNPEA